ncbi:ADAMTS-like protein 2 [Echeneis naucrates]|uniref:ADAMTS-like protein 2 n=1 Tax=Echeneis naucrates TaxID=173247 RepID=UPI0011135A37|nr:ADAMTS-like protein 2 [Echeneis naucrates]
MSEMYFGAKLRRDLLLTTQNINSSYCSGSPKKYQLCPNQPLSLPVLILQPCPSPSVSFKEHQCSHFNSKAFGERHYQWIPLYPADYISISNKPCDLQCTTINGERQLLVPAHDGTFCRDPKYDGVCIEGVCQPVGCEGKLYSLKTVDRCGVCGGNGASCQRFSGSYRKALTQLGYVFITNIPAGAKDIHIIERHKTENILALSDEAGHFFFNGNTVIDNPQNFQVAGTVFKYRRPTTIFSDGLEYMIAQGPTTQGLNLMYYNLNGKLPHITYKYTVPHKSRDLIAGESATMSSGHSHHNFTDEELNEDIGGDHNRLTNHSRENVTNLHHYNSNLGADNQSDVQLEEEEDREEKKEDGEEAVWEIWTPSPPPAAILVYRPTDITNHVFNHNYVEEQEPPLPSGYSESTNLIDEPSSADDNTVVVSFPVSVQLQQVSAVQVANTESNDFDVALEPDISLVDMYRWKVSAYAPCSSTCTTGITTSYAHCVRYDGTEVDDSFCDSMAKPEPAHEFCSGLECAPRWETSGWSECSRICGKGVQYRTVRCWKMLSPGLDSSVYDMLCLSHDLHKPTNRKLCLGQSCGPQWEVSEWSECSASCGTWGVQTREVRCSMEMRKCNKSSKPVESQECEALPCNRRWTVSDWGPCSGVCGEGRMVRAVTCRSSNGVVMSEGQCDQSLRPLAIYPCGERNCAPHWVEQEWQKCDTACGRGVRQRQVVCAGLESGVFKEFPDSSCIQSSKPESSSSCFQRPCSKWFTTSWSQCSKTCGSGIQIREVKCYQGEELVTRGYSCNSTIKPEARQSCEMQSCQTEAQAVVLAESVAVDDSCQDKPTANCALVLKVKLCSHWYYRKACCQSCKGLRS